MKILIADDHDLILQPLEELISAFGDEFESTCIDTIDGALKLLSKQHFDFVLSDLYFRTNTPSFTVIEAAKDLGIPSAVLSAETSPELLERAYKAGAQSYISKTQKFEPMRLLIHLTIVHGVSTAPLLYAQSTSVLERVEAMSEGAKRTIKMLSENPGIDHKTLARLVNYAPNTVKTYMSHWMRVFGVNSSGAAAEEFKKVYGIHGR
jgi:DNA-binding NarL/FixJ family response regulator